MKAKLNSTYFSSSNTKIQATIAKTSHILRAKSFKTHPPMDQRFKAQAKRPQPKRAFVYIKRHTLKHTTSYNYMHTCNCMSHVHFRIYMHN